MRFVGIDPGASGGIAWLDENGAECLPLPDTEDQIFDTLHMVFAHPSSTTVAIERVHAIPGIGSTTSSFTFGRSFGYLRGILASTAVAWRDVPPQTWQRGLGLAKDLQGPARKRVLRSIAAQRFPSAKVTLKTADALLIADWLRGQEQTGACGTSSHTLHNQQNEERS